MTAVRSAPLLAGVAFLALMLIAPGASLGANPEGAVFDPPIAGPPSVETGIWRTKVQTVFDPATRTLVRRMYVVLDPFPSRDLDFVWIPDSFAADKEGKVEGSGHLIWRLKGKPAYDRASIFAEYRGAMKDGRPEGQGTYVDATGIAYQGEWKNGLMDGFGTLTLPGGDEYVGRMRAGKANGSGRYIVSTGEIFEGRFVDGERDGLGTTTLPNGNSYRSAWVQGKETEDSRRLRVAQAGGRPTPGAGGGGDDVRIGISVDKTGSRDGDLVYAASSSGPQLVIRPDNKRLMDLWKGGGEIQLLDDEEGGEEFGVFSLAKGQLFPLTLVFEVQNRASAPIEVSGATLAVDQSVSDLQPAIQLNRDLGQCGGADFRPLFRAQNFGWGAAQSAALHFAFANPNVSARPTVRPVTKTLGNIVQQVDVNLEPELQAAGVNIATLRAKSDEGFVCSKTTSAPACLQQIKATGVFGRIASQIGLKDTSIFVSAAGTLDYTWQDSKGAPQTASSPFNVRLPLGHIKIEAECGEGGQRDLIASRPLEFRLDQSGYRLPVSFKRRIPSGQTARFTVTVSAPKSSQHQFKVVLQLSDGREISSRPINLLYFVPSWFPAT